MQVKVYIFILFSILVSKSFAQKEIDLESLFNLELSPDERAKVKAKIYDFSQQINEDPNNFIHYYNRGVMYGRLGIHNDAISDYNKAISLNDGFPQAYYNRALSKARFGITKAACIDLKKSAELGFSQAQTMYNDKCGLYF
jgi:tetratricopeptide (TPR) repeat protein